MAGVSEEAVEAVARRLCPVPGVWEKAEAKRIVEAARPGILSDLRRELLGDEAVEALAKKRAVDVHGSQWGGRHAWEKFKRERPADLERYREQARADLQVALDSLDDKAPGRERTP